MSRILNIKKIRKDFFCKTDLPDYCKTTYYPHFGRMRINTDSRCILFDLSCEDKFNIMQTGQHNENTSEIVDSLKIVENKMINDESIIQVTPKKLDNIYKIYIPNSINRNLIEPIYFSKYGLQYHSNEAFFCVSAKYLSLMSGMDVHFGFNDSKTPIVFWERKSEKYDILNNIWSLLVMPILFVDTDNLEKIE